MSWATNQSLYKIHTGRGGEGEWQFPVGTGAWLESTQLPCQYPPAHQVIQYTCTLWVHVPPPLSADQHTLMGILWGYKGTEEGVEKEWEALRNSMHTAALCFTPIKGLLQLTYLKKCVICTNENIILRYPQKKSKNLCIEYSFTFISMAVGAYVSGKNNLCSNCSDDSIKDNLKSNIFFLIRRNIFSLSNCEKTWTSVLF